MCVCVMSYLRKKVHEEITESTQPTKEHVHVILWNTPVSMAKKGEGRDGH